MREPLICKALKQLLILHNKTFLKEIDNGEKEKRER